MPINTPRRRALNTLAAALALTLGAAGMAQAQSHWPAKPVRIVVPYGPGGASDNFARAIGESLAKDFKQSFVVENKPGAGGIIAANAVMAAPADGHTIYYVTESMYVLTQLTAQHMGRPVAVDMRKEFVPVSTIAEIPIVLSIRSDIPASNLQEFLAYARKQSGALNYASDGPGSSTHLGGEMLKMAGKFDAVHVPYKGTGDQMTGIMGG